MQKCSKDSLPTGFSAVDAQESIPKQDCTISELRPDAVIRTKDDLHLPDNYLFYLGTPTSPLTGGFSLSADYKEFRLSVNGVYSVGAKQFEYIRPPVSYSSTEYGQEITVNEMVQTFQNDLFTQYLNVNRDMFNRWTPENKTDVSLRACGIPIRQITDLVGNIRQKQQSPKVHFSPSSLISELKILFSDTNFLKIHTTV